MKVYGFLRKGRGDGGRFSYMNFTLYEKALHKT